MTKKLRWFSVIAVFAVIIGAGYILFFTARESSPQVQQKAISDGLEYLQTQGPETCGQAITPATHTPTGAKYTFSNTCLPPGWVAD